VINENALRDALIAFVEQQKGAYLMIYSILGEVAALRETVRALDPTFDDALAEKRKENSTSPKLLAVLQGCNEIIRRLKAGEVC